jgi:hypothetical protein
MDESRIPRVGPEHWKSLLASGSAGTEPMLVAGLIADSEAVRAWTPDTLGERFAEYQMAVAVDLPAAGSPYDLRQAPHVRTMTMSQYAVFVSENVRTYLPQGRLSLFPGLAEEVGYRQHILPPEYGVNIWIGNATRSGLHFDWADGLLMQVYGSKTAVLVPPGNYSRLYVHADSPYKSRVDPDAPDDPEFPRFADVPRLRAELTPGDALFIPKHWWHHLVADSVSISVNAWFGPTDQNAAWASTILHAGPQVWGRTVADFVRLGVLKGGFEKRLFSGKPAGLQLYETYVAGRFGAK